jgi:hypothetical protein
MTARDAESDLSPFQAIAAFSVPSGQFHAHRCSGTSAPSVRQLIMVKVGNPVAVIELRLIPASLPQHELFVVTSSTSECLAEAFRLRLIF